MTKYYETYKAKYSLEERRAKQREYSRKWREENREKHRDGVRKARARNRLKKEIMDSNINNDSSSERVV